MRLFPIHQETVTLACSAQRAEALLYHKVAMIDDDGLGIERIDKVPIFNGVVKNGWFSISLKVKRGNAFLPRVNGKITPNPTGCEIACTYELFGSTRLLLGFWTFMTLAMAIIFTFIAPQPTHAIFSLGICVGNYAIALANFRLQCKRTKRQLLAVWK